MSEPGHEASIRVATWNVGRPSANGWKIPPAQRDRMAEVNADIWILTETRIGHAPSNDHQNWVTSPPDIRRLTDGECSAAIWSRWPITKVTDPAPHPRGTVAGVVQAPIGPVLVYATIIPYANETTFDDGSGPARRWQAHMASIGRQSGEWQKLQKATPGMPMIVAGDFNQDRDGSRVYGTRDGRNLLTTALDSAGLICLTADDMVAAGQLESDHLIDHISATGDLVPIGPVRCWEKVDRARRRLSDHPTVAVDLHRAR